MQFTEQVAAAIKVDDAFALNALLSLVKGKRFTVNESIFAAILADASNCLEVLLACPEANINYQNRLGCTPVFVAAQSKKVTALERLLKAGGDPNIKNYEEVSPLESLLPTKAQAKAGGSGISWNFRQAVTLLCAAGAVPDEAGGLKCIAAAFNGGYVDIAHILLQSRVPVGSQKDDIPILESVKLRWKLSKRVNEVINAYLNALAIHQGLQNAPIELTESLPSTAARRAPSVV